MRNLVAAIFVFSSILCSNAWSASLVGRLGIGMSNHLVTDMSVLSMKLQRNRSSAFGGSFGLDSSSEGTFYAVGLKYYRYIYEEPQLNFYSALGANLFTYQDTESDGTANGYQVDGTFGSEFSFQGLESLGFSFEFGVSFNKYEGESRIQTLGVNFIQSAIHFYL